MEFELGEIYATNNVAKKAEKDSDFYNFVNNVFCKKYCSCDWGDTCKEDSQQNDEAVKNGGRILAAYKQNVDTTIWIITEEDRSCRRILNVRKINENE